MDRMHDRLQNSRRRLGSLSIRGFAGTRALVAVLLLVALVMLAFKLFPTREERLWKTIDGARAAFVENREQDFLATFDPDVRYQTSGGLPEIKRQFEKWKREGLPPPNIVKREATFDDEGADVRLDVVITVELRPIAQAKVKLRLVDRDGPWRVTTAAWE